MGARVRVAPQVIRPAPPKSTAPTTTAEAIAAAPEPEARLVESALAARAAHDPVAAGRLLDTYLARFPQGVLVEEALSAAIDAAGRRGDRTAAAAYGARYLKSFPQGRWADLARRAVESDR